MYKKFISIGLIVAFALSVVVPVGAENLYITPEIDIDFVEFFTEDEKEFSDATIEDDFKDDVVFVILNKETSRNNQDFTVEDFSEINALSVEDIDRLSENEYDYAEDVWESQRQIEDLSMYARNIRGNRSNSRGRQSNERAMLSETAKQISSAMDEYEDIREEADENTLVNFDEYKRIISITLAEPGKENVLEAIRLLEQRDDIHYAGPSYISQEPKFESSQTSLWDPSHWFFGRIGLQNAWNITTGSSNIKVGVIDSGLDGNHPLFQNKLHNSSKSFVKDPCGNHICNINLPQCHPAGNLNKGTFSNPYIPVYDGSDVEGYVKPTSHGTRVGGVILGVAPNVLLVSLKVNGGANDGQIAEAVTYSRANNIQVLNTSLGIGKDGDNDAPLTRAAVRNYNGLFVVSAGNDNSNTDSVNSRRFYGFSNVIVVGASNQYELRWNPSNSTNASNWGNQSVHLFAPGQDIHTANVGGGYITDSGTSLAAPFVAGTAALILSKNANLTPEQVKYSILEGVDKDGSNFAQLNNLSISGGRLNVLKALQISQGNLPNLPAQVGSITINGSTNDMTTLGNSRSLSVTVLPERATNKAVTWSSSNSSIISVDGDGRLTVRDNGTVTITATADDGSGVSASVTINANDTRITNAPVLTPGAPPLTNQSVSSTGLLYRFTPSVTGRYVFTTSNTIGGNINGRIHFSGEPVTGTNIRMSAYLTADQTYYIEIRREGTTGTRNFAISAYREISISTPVDPTNVNAGSVSGGGSVPLSSTVNLTATPNPGYSFIGWYENWALVSENANFPAFLATVDRTLQARFARNISNAGDFDVMSNSSARYILTNNIDLDESPFEPIQNFYGSFNGNGHKISNLNINKGEAEIGLFKQNSGTIENLTLEDVNVVGGGTSPQRNHTGTIAGINNGTIKNVHVSGAVYGYGDRVGGLVGENKGSIIDCSSAANVTGGAHTGGLIGWFESSNGIVSGSYATGNVTGRDRTGGLIGTSNSPSNSPIQNSYATGNVEGRLHTGGFVGRMARGKIEQSYATGNVTNLLDSVSITEGAGTGGFVGTMGDETTIIDQCYSTSVVTINNHNTNNMWRGGFVGYAKPNATSNATSNATISNSFAVSKMTSRENRSGGFAGFMNGTIQNSYAVSNSHHGFVGVGDATVTNSYFDIDLGGADEDNGRPTLQMYDIDTYEGWNGDVWNFSGTNYPTLKNTGGTPDFDKSAVPLALRTSVSSIVRIGKQDWYTFTPDIPGSHTFTTTGAAVNIEIFNQNGDSIAEGSSSVLAGYLNDNETYKIRVLGNTAGNYTLRIDEGTPFILGSDETFTIENNTTNWHIVKPSVSGYFTIAAKGTATTSVELYQGNTQITPDYVNTGFDDNFRISLNLYAGVTYNLKITGNSSGEYALESYEGYIILKPEDLDGISNMSIQYTLMNDINLNGTEHTPIGTLSAPFTGTFDGNGHTISNFKITKPNDDNVGLFGYTIGTIRNLNISNATVVGYQNTGILAGNVYGGTIINCHILDKSNVAGFKDNVGGLIGINRVDVTGSSARNVTVLGGVNYLGERLTNGVNTSHTGGLIGNNNNGEITNSHATGKVLGIIKVGGLVGMNGNGQAVISNSYSKARVIAISNSAGGLVGDNTGIIKNYSYATGNVSGPELTPYSAHRIGGLVGEQRNGKIVDSHATGKVDGSVRVGGLIGTLNNNNTEVEKSYATGNVTGHFHVGGFVGMMENGIVKLSNSSGNVEVKNENNGGGFIGCMDAGTIEQSYVSDTTITASNNSKTMGGFIGNGTSSSAIIRNSFAVTTMTSGANSAGFAGAMAGTIENSYAVSNNTKGFSNGGTITNCFFDADIAGATDSNAIGKTTAEMKQGDIYIEAGWDDNTIWLVDHNKYTYWNVYYMEAYPMLRGLDQPWIVEFPIVNISYSWDTVNYYHYIDFPSKLIIIPEYTGWHTFFISSASTLSETLQWMEAGHTYTIEIQSGFWHNRYLIYHIYHGEQL